MNPEELKTLNAQCQEIKTEGDIYELLRSIKMETNRAFALLDEENPQEHADEVATIAESINQKTKRVLNLSKTEWTNSNWNHLVSWRINSEDFKDLIGTKFNKGFSILNAEIESVSIHGKKRNDLISKINLHKKYNLIDVNYENKSSSLDICQLEKTLVVTLRVDYRNIKNQSTRYFNLTVK